MITIKNFSDVSEEKIKRLTSSLNALSIPGNFTIEVWDSARDVHSPEEIKKIYLIPSGKELGKNEIDGKMNIQVPEVHCHTAVVFEY